MNNTKSCHCCAGSGTELDHPVVGAEMRRLRELQGLSMSEIARRMNLSLGFLSDLERGRRNWNEEKIAAYKKALA